jgi:hypothetical protein
MVPGRLGWRGSGRRGPMYAEYRDAGPAGHSPPNPGGRARSSLTERTAGVEDDAVEWPHDASGLEAPSSEGSLARVQARFSQPSRRWPRSGG